MSDRLADLIIELTGCQLSEIQDTRSLVDDLGLDSIDLVELQLAAEAEFGFVADSSITSVVTVLDLRNYIAIRATR